MKLLGFLISLMIPITAGAQINDTFRSQNAVVWYRFQETVGDVIDSGNPSFGPPANLQVVYPEGVSRLPGILEITNANLIRSRAPVDKIYNACRASNAMSLELWIENNENVERRAGNDAKTLPQPLRMISYSKGIYNRNFLFGQFYDMGNIYMGAVNNSSSEPASEANNNLGNSLQDPMVSDVSATLVPEMGGAVKAQKIYVTYKQNVARLYLTDTDGRLYLHKMFTQGYTGTFSTWRPGAYLTLGNEYIPDSNIGVMGFGTLFASCDPTKDAVCGTNPNRYWKGKIFQVAVYCRELTGTDIFGSTAVQVLQNPVFPVNPSLQITPTLKKAQAIHQRLTGINTPIVNPILQQMEQRLNSNDPLGAAALATDSAEFYNNVVRDFAAKMSNRDETIVVPLNDFTATIVGAVRDDISAKQLLTGNITYVADNTKAAVPSNVVADMLISNNHYESLQRGGFDLSRVLIRTTQKLYDGSRAVENPTPAGLLTSRQWLAAHAVAGTNRRPVEFAFREFLCTPIENVADASGPDNVIGPDIDRFPGGSHSKFISNCRACHTILDGFRPAFAHITFSNNFVKHSFVVPGLGMNDDEDNDIGMIQNPQFIAKKLNHNETVFPGGRITDSDLWVNNANYGINKELFAWTQTNGQGIANFGKLISESKQFPLCMAKRVFRSVCKREAVATDEAMLKTVANEFATSRSHNLKFLFQKIVTSPECLGGQ